MKRLILVILGLSALVWQSTAQTAQTGFAQRASDRMAPVRSVLDTYCAGCHSVAGHAGGVAFAGMPLDPIGANAEVWEKAVRKLRGRLMPPPGSKQPDAAEAEAFVHTLEDALDHNPDRPVAGHVPIQRMTRTEYGTTVKDLLGVEIDAESLLPTEIEVGGFDNIAAALSMSPAFLDQYVGAARLAAHLAVGEPRPKKASSRYPLLSAENQFRHIDGLPLGTRGGLKFRHNFPADGEYRFTVLDLDIGLYTTLATRATLILLVDGREMFRQSLGGPEDLSMADHGGAPARTKIMERFANIPVQVKAGFHDVVVTFIERAETETDEFINAGLKGDFGRAPHPPRLMDGVTVVGPLNSPGVSETPSRQRVFICRPADGASMEVERACARDIIENLTRRAFRRPTTKDDVDSVMPYFESGRKTPGGFDAGIERAIAAVLVSPDFLYRSIRTPTNKDDGAFPLSNLELASRLSFFLWSQGPDDTLLKIAIDGRLTQPGVLEAQARRMLADPRAAALVHNFALKWLRVDDLSAVQPDPVLFPEFSDALRRDFATEIESFVASILLQDRGVNDLLTARHTFLNEPLARHYGITTVFGPQFRRVEVDQDPERWGLLGKGAVLLRTSYGDRTSPVLRGSWVLDKLMGTPPTPPPPDVDTDLSTPKGEKPKTLRARLEQHRSKASCNQCHGVIDPIGLAMENYDAIGRWRVVDTAADAPIDAKTVLPNGKSIDGPAQLRNGLFPNGSDQFAQALTEKLLMYAVGRELQYYDMPQVRAIVRRAAKDDYRLPAIVAGIVQSDAFRMQSVRAK